MIVNNAVGQDRLLIPLSPSSDKHLISSHDVTLVDQTYIYIQAGAYAPDTGHENEGNDHQR